jgi:hypothetical protein
MWDMADQIEAFVRKVTFLGTPPAQFKEGEHISCGNLCPTTIYSTPSPAHQGPAGCGVVSLTKLQRLLLLRFSPSYETRYLPASKKHCSTFMKSTLQLQLSFESLSTTGLLQTYPGETIELLEVRQLLSGPKSTQPLSNKF